MTTSPGCIASGSLMQVPLKTGDERVAAAVEEFSLTRDASLLRGADCACREEWLDVLELEAFLQGSQP